MPLRKSLLIAALALCSCQPNDPTASKRHAIVNGTFDPGDPAVVFLLLDGFDECSGTLISPRVVLTARHCIEGFSAADVQVFFGSDINGAGDWLGGVHLELSRQNPGEDIDLGLVTLDRPGPAAPIPANDRELSQFIGQQVRVVGFGVTGEDETESGIKRQGTTALASVDTHTLSTGFVGSNTCYGDSGGPNIMIFGGQEYVVGVTSYGTTICGQPEDVSARTDTQFDWIDGYIAIHDPIQGNDAGFAPDAAPPFDAGFRPDAQTPFDAGFADFGVAIDGGLPQQNDAGTNSSDAGMQQQIEDTGSSSNGPGVSRRPRSGGCRCVDAPKNQGAILIMSLIGLVYFRRSRGGSNRPAP